MRFSAVPLIFCPMKSARQSQNRFGERADLRAEGGLKKNCVTNRPRVAAQHIAPYSPPPCAFPAQEFAWRFAANWNRSVAQPGYCLLYTSDAADDLLCVDLGGR